MSTSSMRVRFAPSPTGPFHIGGARSALFNWLLARKMGGTFVLRVEDTDLERSTQESEENIKEALRWLGMDWDEGVDKDGPYGPYRQTERLELYKKYTKQLLAEGKAYYCYCSEEELDRERQAQLAKGQTPLYSGHCRELTEKQRQEYENQGRKPTIRLRVPLGQAITFKDMVRGIVTFESDGVGDFILVKSDKIPVYNYAVVLDDALMQISHVIRAEEHLSNTPRQILIYQALGFALPEFGHISLILGKDRSKMSKRHGATSVEQYRKLGYLPAAINNFLALLGWSPEGEEELFSCEELIQQFNMDRVAKNPAVFDLDKLNYINQQYMKQLSEEELLTLCLPHLEQAGYVQASLRQEEKAQLQAMVAAVRSHIHYAAQVVEHVGIFFTEKSKIENEEELQILRDPTFPLVYAAFSEKLQELEELNPSTVQSLLKSIIKENKWSGKKVYMPIRIALTGCTHGPELIDIIPILGKQRTLSRMRETLQCSGISI